MKKIAILQSNYIPWKGYFDLIASVDEFIIYDDMQFTKNDWRNRNKIKTKNGLEWLSVPVGQDIKRRIRDVELQDSKWQEKHWKTIVTNYARADHYIEISKLLAPIYLNKKHNNLSQLNIELIQTICDYLNIKTKITKSWDYELIGDKTERLINLCKQTKANVYISGPAAKDYLNEDLFIEAGINLKWFNYQNYEEYNQLWEGFQHGVSIIDLLFNCGAESSSYMNFAKHIE